MDGESETTAAEMFDLRSVPEAKRAKASHRMELLKRWHVAKRAAAVLGFSAAQGTGRFLQQLHLATGEELSRGTLYRLDRAYRTRGLAGLIDGRGGKRKGATNVWRLERIRSLAGEGNRKWACSNPTHHRDAVERRR